ncbi:MAG: hypothetical protein JKY19_03075 [Alcanivoracaceae bacterium]|nr:hypothetical protein [Alcanivoracaceae bacterium]
MKEKNILMFVVLIMVQIPVFAYIGPGAGIPFIGSFIGFIVTIILVICAILFWPIRQLLKKKKLKSQNKES